MSFTAKEALLEKCGKSIFQSKKGIMAAMTLTCAMLIFFGSLYGILKLHGENATAIVNLAQVVIGCVSATMTAIILGVNILDIKSVVSLENVAKSEVEKHIDGKSEIVKNITETIENKVEAVLPK